MRPSSKDTDAFFMSRALELAAGGLSLVSPNPMVGAVLVRNGKIIAEGFHQKWGGDHAEIEALKKVRFQAKGATLYCNLEPCFHQGKTPPCIHPVIQSGVSRVVIAHQDPNPLVQGKSIRLLEKEGISVETGVLESQARFLNRFFLTWIEKKRPYILLKVAMSLDGKLLPAGRKSAWITGEESRRKVWALREAVDAVLVGVNTVLADNPRLNVRSAHAKNQPVRIVLDSRLRTPLHSNLFKKGGGPVLLATLSGNRSKTDACRKKGAEILRLKGSSSNRIPLKPLMRKLAERKIASLLVEGGSEIFSSFFGENLCDELRLLMAPKIFGGAALDAFSTFVGKNKSIPFKLHSVASHGPDLELYFIRREFFERI